MTSAPYETRYSGLVTEAPNSVLSIADLLALILQGTDDQQAYEGAGESEEPVLFSAEGAQRRPEAARSANLQGDPAATQRGIRRLNPIQDAIVLLQSAVKFISTGPNESSIRPFPPLHSPGATAAIEPAMKTSPEVDVPSDLGTLSNARIPMFPFSVKIEAVRPSHLPDPPPAGALAPPKDVAADTRLPAPIASNTRLALPESVSPPPAAAPTIPSAPADSVVGSPRTRTSRPEGDRLPSKEAPRESCQPLQAHPGFTFHAPVTASLELQTPSEAQGAEPTVSEGPRSVQVTDLPILGEPNRRPEVRDGRSLRGSMPVHEIAFGARIDTSQQPRAFERSDHRLPSTPSDAPADAVQHSLDQHAGDSHSPNVVSLYSRPAEEKDKMAADRPVPNRVQLPAVRADSSGATVLPSSGVLDGATRDTQADTTASSVGEERAGGQRIVETAPQMDRSAQPTRREITVTIQSADGRPVVVTLLERHGKVDVIVRTTDVQRAESLRTELSDLARSLERHGYRIDTWTPTSSNPGTSDLRADTTLKDNGSQDHSHSGNQRESQGGQRDSRERRPNPEWVEEMLRRLGRQ